MRPMAMLAAGLVLFAAAANAELYRWVDRDGRENYTNDQSKIPAEHRDRSAKIEAGQGSVSISDQAGAPAGGRSALKEHRDKNGRGEEWWHRRAENLRREIRDLRDEYDLVLQQEQRDAQRESRNGRGRRKSGSKHEQKKLRIEKKIGQATRRLEVDLPEEARKAEAYPGWLRE